MLISDILKIAIIMIVIVYSMTIIIIIANKMHKFNKRLGFRSNFSPYDGLDDYKTDLMRIERVVEYYNKENGHRFNPNEMHFDCFYEWNKRCGKIIKLCQLLGAQLILRYDAPKDIDSQYGREYYEDMRRIGMIDIKDIDFETKESFT